MLTEDPVGFDSEAFMAAQNLISQNLNSVFQVLQGVDMQSGLSFLNGKIIIYAQILRDLLLNNLALLRSQQLQDHPVCSNLLFNKVLFTKLEPIQAKMNYELNKLIKLADNQDQSATQSDNPLFLKPRPDLLVNDDIVKQGIYRAPKIQSELPPQIKKKRKQQNRETRELQRVRMKYLRDEMDQQDNINMLQVYKQSAAQRKKRQYEEENFIRLPQTKQERKIRLQKQKGNRFASQGGMLNDIADFSELKKVRKAFGLHDDQEQSQDRPSRLPKRIKKGKKLKSKRRKGDY